MGSLDRHLDADERIVFRTRLHPVVFTGAVGFAAFVIGVAALVVVRNPLAPGTARTLLLGGLAVAAGGFVMPVLRWRRTEFAVTPRRLLATVGLLPARVVELRHGEAAVEVEQTLGGRLLGYGTVVLGDVVFHRVARALVLQAAVPRAVPRSPRVGAR